MLDDMLELRTAYIISLANKAERLAQALSSKDFETVERLGHQLKGSGSTYGFPEISALGAQLEAAGEDRQWTVAESLIAEFKQCVGALQD
jgi:HPt (histidine-containing phosphotransfer) domain-containing protein